MKNNFIHVCFIIDCSGSMYHSTQDVEGGFQRIIDEQKANTNGTCAISLFEFDDSVQQVYIGKDINNINSYKFTTRGCTAMYDGIGTAIDKIGKWLSDMPENERPEKNIIVIMTDGYENASKEYKASQVKNMIKHQEEKYNWTFMYIGTDISNTDDADNLGIHTKFASTRSKLGKSYDYLNTVFNSYRNTSGDSIKKNATLTASIANVAATSNAEYLKDTGIKID